MSSTIYIEPTNMNHPERITRLETRMDNVQNDITEIKDDQKELLKAMAERDRTLYKIVGIGIAVGVMVEGAILFLKH